MLTALKKKREPGLPASLAWHPNFRNREKLPDLKVVRTTFFINGAAVFVALTLALLVAFQEFKIGTLRADLNSWETKIEESRRTNGEVIAKFRKFQAAEKLVKEAITVAQSRIGVSDFVIKLGETLPENIAMSSIEFNTTGVQLTGVVRGSPEMASGYASQYVDQLRTSEDFAALFNEVTLTGLSRDPSTGQIAIAVSLNYTAKK